MNEQQTRQQLHQVESYLARLREQADKAQAERDRLVRELCDSEGAAGSRFVGVR